MKSDEGERLQQDLLQQLVQEAAREESPSEQELVLARLTLGQLDDSARAALEQQARQDPQLAQAVARYRPAGADSRQRIADRLMAQIAAAGSAHAPASPVTRRARRVRFAVSGMMAMAAAVLLWARPWSDGGEGQSGTDPGLPAYTLIASGGDSAQRRTPAAPDAQPEPRPLDGAPLLLTPRAPLEIVVRPAATVQGRIDARVFLHQGSRWEPASGAPEIAPTGSVRVRGSAAAILGPRRGPWQLVVLVGRPAVFAGEGIAEQLARGPAASGPGWQRLALPVTVVAD